MKRFVVLLLTCLLIPFSVCGLPGGVFTLKETSPGNYALYEYYDAGNNVRYHYPLHRGPAFRDFYVLEQPTLPKPVVVLLDNADKNVYAYNGTGQTKWKIANAAAIGQFSKELAVVLLEDRSILLVDAVGTTTEASIPWQLGLRGKPLGIAGVDANHVAIVTTQELTYVSLNSRNPTVTRQVVDLTAMKRADPVLDLVFDIRAAQGGAWLATSKSTGMDRAFAFVPYDGSAPKIKKWPTHVFSSVAMIGIDRKTETLFAEQDDSLVEIDHATLWATELEQRIFDPSRFFQVLPQKPVTTRYFYASFPSTGSGDVTRRSTDDGKLKAFLDEFKGKTKLTRKEFCTFCKLNEAVLERVRLIGFEALAQYGLSFRGGFYLEPTGSVVSEEIDLAEIGRLIIVAESKGCPAQAAAAAPGSNLTSP